MEYKLSPADFKYLWEDCRHCYYQKVKNGVKTPSMPFPGIFGKLNNMLQDSIVGMNMQAINPGLPDAVVEIKEGYLKSIPIPGTTCYINGRFDILSKAATGGYTLIDFKIMEPDEEKMDKYASQLHAYKYALEHPAPYGSREGIPRQVSQMGIVAISPRAMELEDGNVIFTSTPVFREIEPDMDEFFSLIEEIYAVLEGPTPPRSGLCEFCKYVTRWQGEVLSG